MVSPPLPARARNRKAAIEAACRIAVRIRRQGGTCAEALRFLTSASVRYLGGGTEILAEDPSGKPTVAASAGIPDLSSGPSQPAGSGRAADGRPGHLSLTIRSADGKTLGRFNLYAADVRASDADDIAALEALTRAAARLLNG